MANDVFANGMEIASKAGDNKVLAAFPDVCLSPPSPPAGPIPIPYPLFSKSADATAGSKAVKISGKEVMLRDQSYYKTCKGDEAATKTLGQGVVTHTLTGKVYFLSWSMDVLIEGKNVDRHLDMTTSNHASPMANQCTPIPGMDTMSPAITKDCKATWDKHGVSRYGSAKCPDGQASHHPAMNACFVKKGTRDVPIPNVGKYNTLDAPGVCVEHGPGSTHADLNKLQNEWARGLSKEPTYKDLRAESKAQLKSKDGGGMSEKEAECVMKAVDAYMKTINVDNSTVLRIPGR